MRCTVVRRASWLCATLAALVMAGPAGATTISLDTGKSLSVSPGASGTFTFSATNDAGAITSDFLGWTMGIQLLPSGTTVGTMTIGALAQSLTNPMPTGVVDISQPALQTLALSGTINGLTEYYLIGMAATEVLGSLSGNTSYNLGDLTVNASANAQGTWNVYAVQQGGSFYKTYWTNSTLTDVDFGNLVRGPQGTNNSILIGTVTAVPEPSTIALLGMSMAIAGWYAWRTRRKVTVEIVEAS